MANYILHSGANRLLKSGNYILTSSNENPVPDLDVNPALLENYTDGQIVPVIPDGGDKHINIFQETTGKQGVYKANLYNGKPAIRLTGASKMFYSLSPNVLVGTMMIVFKNSGSTNGLWHLVSDPNQNYFHGGTGTTIFHNAATFFGGIATNRLFQNGGRVSSTLAVKTTNLMLLTLDVGVPMTAGVNYSSILSYIGARVAYDDGYFTGDLVRLICYSKRLTELQRVNIENELKTLYGL